MIVVVDVIVDVVDTVIVAVHLHGNDTLIVIPPEPAATQLPATPAR
jgi:hypothetical protein